MKRFLIFVFILLTCSMFGQVKLRQLERDSIKFSVPTPKDQIIIAGDTSYSQRYIPGLAWLDSLGVSGVQDYYISNDTLYLTTTDSTYAVIVPTSEDIRVDTVVFGSLPFTPSANAGFTVIMSDGTEFPINFEGALDFLFNDVQLGVYTRNDMTFTKSGYDFVLNTYLTEDVAYPIRPKIYVSETEPLDTITDYPDYALFPGYLWKKPSTGEVWQLNQDMDWILISDLIPEMGTVIDSFNIANDTAYIYLADTTLKAEITHPVNLDNDPANEYILEDNIIENGYLTRDDNFNFSEFERTDSSYLINLSSRIDFQSISYTGNEFNFNIAVNDINQSAFPTPNGKYLHVIDRADSLIQYIVNNNDYTNLTKDTAISINDAANNWGIYIDETNYFIVAANKVLSYDIDSEFDIRSISYTGNFGTISVGAEYDILMKDTMFLAVGTTSIKSYAFDGDITNTTTEYSTFSYGVAKFNPNIIEFGDQLIIHFVDNNCLVLCDWDGSNASSIVFVDTICPPEFGLASDGFLKNGYYYISDYGNDDIKEFSYDFLYLDTAYTDNYEILDTSNYYVYSTSVIGKVVPGIATWLDGSVSYQWADVENYYPSWSRLSFDFKPTEHDSIKPVFLGTGEIKDIRLYLKDRFYDGPYFQSLSDGGKAGTIQTINIDNGSGIAIDVDDEDWIKGVGVVYNNTDFIGINTSSPGYDLDVHGDLSVSQILVQENGTPGGASNVFFGERPSSTRRELMMYGASQSNRFGFSVAPTDLTKKDLFISLWATDFDNGGVANYGQMAFYGNSDNSDLYFRTETVDGDRSDIVFAPQLNEILRVSDNDSKVTISGSSLQMSDYGFGGETGTLTYLLGVDVNGNVIERTVASVQDGTGTDDQILSLVTDTLSIEDGNSVDLSGYLDNTDAQDISTSGAAGNITIDNGSTLNLNVNDADASITNEGVLSMNTDLANTTFSINSNSSGSVPMYFTEETSVTGNNRAVDLERSGNSITFNLKDADELEGVTISAAADYVLVWDATDSDWKSTTISNLPGDGTGTDDQGLVIVSAAAGTINTENSALGAIDLTSLIQQQVVQESTTVGTGFDLSGYQVVADFSEFTTDAIPEGDEFIIMYDVSGVTHEKIDIDDLATYIGSGELTTVGTGFSLAGYQINADFDAFTSDNTFSGTDEVVYLSFTTHKRGTLAGLGSYMQTNWGDGTGTDDQAIYYFLSGSTPALRLDGTSTGMEFDGGEGLVSSGFEEGTLDRILYQHDWTEFNVLSSGVTTSDYLLVLDGTDEARMQISYLATLIGGADGNGLWNSSNSNTTMASGMEPRVNNYLLFESATEAPLFYIDDAATDFMAFKGTTALPHPVFGSADVSVHGTFGSSNDIFSQDDIRAGGDVIAGGWGVFGGFVSVGDLTEGPATGLVGYGSGNHLTNEITIGDNLEFTGSRLNVLTDAEEFYGADPTPSASDVNITMSGTRVSSGAGAGAVSGGNIVVATGLYLVTVSFYAEQGQGIVAVNTFTGSTSGQWPSVYYDVGSSKVSCSQSALVDVTASGTLTYEVDAISGTNEISQFEIIFIKLSD